MNPLSEYFDEQAAAHRASAAERPDDPRYARSAEALEILAQYAEHGAQNDVFAMRYLLENHIVDGTFRWPTGQSGRAIANFGFDVAVRSEFDLEQFLLDLCDLTRSDAARHIGSHAATLDRADAPQLAKQYGLTVQRVHDALDAGRGIRHLFVVGIPDEHELTAAARAQLEAVDGAIVTHGATDVYGARPPLLVKNLPAVDEDDARRTVAAIVAIDPAALGVTQSPRVLPA